MLTVVTASHRNPSGLRVLAADLVPFLGDKLRWRVKDSGACADTAAWAATLANPYIDFDASPDSGIYDALNLAIAHVTSEFYLVVGSDDRVNGTALLDVLNGLASDPGAGGGVDILTFPVETSRGIRHRKLFRPLWVSSSSLTSSHSVGTLIRRTLHDRLGLYDTRFKILADSLFLRRARLDGAAFLHHDGPVLGVFGLDGVSSSDHGRRLIETYSYMVMTGSPVWLQAGLLGLRLLRYQSTSLL